MPPKAIKVKNQDELERCFSVMKELRPHLSKEEYLSIFQAAQHEGQYEILALEEDNKILALMGYRILTDFVRGRHLYIDDLVSSESVRSKGLGAELLKHAERIALEKNCKVLRLCTGIENQRGMNFYENNGWLKRAYAYVKKIG